MYYFDLKCARRPKSSRTSAYQLGNLTRNIHDYRSRCMSTAVATFARIIRKVCASSALRAFRSAYEICRTGIL